MRTDKRAIVHSVFLDFGTVDGHSEKDLMVTVDGVRGGEAVVIVAAPDLESGLMLAGGMSASQVFIRVSNVTDNPVDVTPQIFNLAVIQ